MYSIQLTTLAAERTIETLLQWHGENKDIPGAFVQLTPDAVLQVATLMVEKTPEGVAAMQEEHEKTRGIAATQGEMLLQQHAEIERLRAVLADAGVIDHAAGEQDSGE